MNKKDGEWQYYEDRQQRHYEYGEQQNVLQNKSVYLAGGGWRVWRLI